MRRCAIRIAVLGAALAAVPAYAQNWSIGQEREVDEGYYLKLLAVHNGWRLWRVETKSGISCMAIKSAVGRPHPQPVGVGAGFYGGTPFLIVNKGYKGNISYGWQGEHLSDERMKFRDLGARFWEEWKYDFDLSPWDGKRVEVNIVTYEYPAINVGRADETAIMDLTGLSAISKAVEQCEGKAP